MDHERIGKYKIVGELGRGTMGEVYKALDPVLNRYVALKTLAVRWRRRRDAFERFQREAQAAALLNHPNIVTIHDFGQRGGLLYMAMELLEGSDLREAIDGGALLHARREARRGGRRARRARVRARRGRRPPRHQAGQHPPRRRAAR